MTFGLARKHGRTLSMTEANSVTKESGQARSGGEKGRGGHVTCAPVFMFNKAEGRPWSEDWRCQVPCPYHKCTRRGHFLDPPKDR
uniref:Uncharacterized protein n=1 Tax=Timema poppense TaxID=170557 RepID=A0A7R9DGP1_TIMPO|nr:unnamed protein product [Timema poppensis]